MAKIKIAYIIDTIESPTSGTEKQLLFLLRSLDRKNFEPYLFCLQSSEWLEKKFDLCPLKILDIKSFKKPATYFHILVFSRFLKSGKFHIVQTHFRDSNIVGIFGAKFARTKVIISSRRNQGYWHNGFELCLLKILNRSVTHFLANSRKTKKWAAEVENIHEKKIHVIHNGVDIELFKKYPIKNRERYRRSWDISNNSPAVGIVANLRPVKGIDVFLRAARLVKNKVPESKFIIVGDGVERDRLKSLCTELGLNDSVKFLGKREDIIQILKALDIGVLSSHSESLSNSVIEYLAAGLPVVCTDAGGCEEAVENGLNGFIVPIGDYQAMSEGILKIIMDRDLSSQMQRRNILKAEDFFSEYTIINLYTKYYQEII
ncbi:MAG: glycosyltransferase [bacterium]